MPGQGPADCDAHGKKPETAGGACSWSFAQASKTNIQQAKSMNIKADTSQVAMATSSVFYASSRQPPFMPAN